MGCPMPVYINLTMIVRTGAEILSYFCQTFHIFNCRYCQKRSNYSFRICYVSNSIQHFSRLSAAYNPPAYFYELQFKPENVLSLLFSWIAFVLYKDAQVHLFLWNVWLQNGIFLFIIVFYLFFKFSNGIE